MPSDPILLHFTPSLSESWDFVFAGSLQVFILVIGLSKLEGKPEHGEEFMLY